ncbi:diacylglycerol/lipid kinase family protein [Sphingosinicella sp. LY1275]|uniref:diacylglycerol/lipid kinase family protein n=1 Tax=Sphingosinicella sp. LY1275 TaxID=3095379 RepID=UPI002ADECD9D|nr:diacylglycerol kinase family protein [Sphingosinicella sp. LY1275]MEA1013034.1 diacylglycerol kinase family protein [Sphingosinicella sp. LY1275]
MHAPRPVPREAVLVVNAASRKGRDLFREAKAKLEAAGIRITAAYPVKNPRKLTSTMRQAVASGTPMVIVGGGDGSLSGTVDDVVDRDCVFALLPLGTANSFARTLGIPLDLDGAVATIATGRRKRIDLGVLDGDYFANCAAMGLSPMIGEGIPHNLKRYLGRVGYLIWAIYCVFRFRPFKLSVDDGVQKHTIWATEVRIANGRFHGGVELIEQAEVDSGDIVIQAVVGRSMAHLLWDWFAKYFKLPAREAAHEEFRGQQLRIDTKPRQKISIDGEVLAKTPAVVEVAHKAIEVVVPA